MGKSTHGAAAAVGTCARRASKRGQRARASNTQASLTAGRRPACERLTSPRPTNESDVGPCRHSFPRAQKFGICYLLLPVLLRVEPGAARYMQQVPT